MKESYAKSEVEREWNRSKHMEVRMNQRGVPQNLINLTLVLGVHRQNGRVELSIRLIEKYLKELDDCLCAVRGPQIKEKVRSKSMLLVMGSDLKLPEFMMDLIDIEWRVPDSVQMIYLNQVRHKYLIKLLMNWRGSLIKARDKKGIVVVVVENTLLTTYSNPEKLGWERRKG